MRVAVLGCGSIGRRHLRNLRALGVGSLTGYEPEPAGRAAAAEELGLPIDGSLDAVWDRRPDVAVVAAPTAAHLPLALEALRHGCQLFIEKPLAASLDGIDELREAADRGGRVTMVACNMRFHPGPATIKTLLDAGRIGEVLSARIQTGSYLPRWRPWQDYHASYSASVETGGAILDCIHEIDLALWYHGPGALRFAASRPARSLGLETDGLAELLIEHDGGALSSVHLNFVQRDYRRGCQIIGSGGTLYWDFERGAVDVYGPDGTRAETIRQPEDWDPNDMYVSEMADFLAAVQGERESATPLAGGIAALRIALEARGACAGVPA